MQVTPDTPLLNFPEYVSAFLRTPPPWPDSLNIGFSNRCNLRCIMCHHAMPGRSPNIEPTDRVWAEIREAVSHTSDVSIAGAGESLLHKNFVGNLEEIGALRPAITLYSSMVPWGKGYPEVITDCVSHLYCSLDAATEQTGRYCLVGE